MNVIDRRALLLGGVAATTVATGGWKSPAQAATMPRSAALGLPRPHPVTSFGPNGTHYPASAPWLGETANTEIEVAAHWTEIANTIRSLTSAQVAAGVVIRVRPGMLPGGGAGSSSPAVLSRLGELSWSRNVVLCPRDGFGTVGIASDGIRLDMCARLSLFGFVSAGSLALTNCANIDIGWSRFDGANITRGGANLAFYELVLGFRYEAEDTVGIRPTGTTQMSHIARFGCLFGPSVKPDGSAAHCDTIQLEGTGTGTFGPFISVDCVDYGSSNAAILLHDRLNRAEFHHCMVLAGELPWRIFPLRQDDYRGIPNAFAGGCRDVRAYDSVIVGPIGRIGFTQVHNTTLSYRPQVMQAPRASGAWVVDTETSQWSASDIMSHQVVGDYSTASMAALWHW